MNIWKKIIENTKEKEFYVTCEYGPEYMNPNPKTNEIYSDYHENNLKMAKILRDKM